MAEIILAFLLGAFASAVGIYLYLKRAERIIMESLKRTRSLSKNQPKEES